MMQEATESPQLYLPLPFTEQKGQRAQSLLPRGGKEDSPTFVAKTQLFGGVSHGRRRPGGCGISF